MYRSTLLFLLCIVFSWSCQNDSLEDEEPEITNENIASLLTPYFETFREKALEYDLVVDYSEANVTAELKSINEGSIAGTCTTNGNDLRHIVIDQSFWNQASHLIREMVIFHELGHCILGRGHTESSFSNGICRSIMRSGLGNCTDAYTTENRDYFIEELFLAQD